MLMSLTELRDAVGMAMGSLRSNKFRSGLTILGVMIGVASVIAMASVIDGLDSAANREIDQLGSNVIMITKFDQTVNYEDLTEAQRNRPAITVGEAEALLGNCPAVDGVSPQNYYYAPGGNTVKYKNRKANQPRLFGTWPDFVRVNNRSLTSGRFIGEADQHFSAMVCVIGSDVASSLFEEEPPVGNSIRINGNQFEVIGVFEKVKSSFGNNELNTSLAIPLATFQKLYPWEEELFLQARARSRADIDRAEEEIISALRVFRKVPFGKENNFALTTQEQFKEAIGNITKWIYIAGFVITSVGLMVGGIGVMNIMLVSVTERTREIGVRKALGAKRSNILFQFLTEATTLSGSGGLIGILFGIGLGAGINALFGFPIGISILWVTVGFFVAATVGILSGMYPAYKASRLDPIEALRYE
jgi:putative ABC transport system permease protein